VPIDTLPIDTVPADTMLANDTLLVGTVISGSVPSGASVGEPTDDETGAYYGISGLGYEAPHAASGGVPGYLPQEEPVADDEPVVNEGLGIFGDMATTEVPEDDAAESTVPANEPDEPPAPVTVIPIGSAWNQPVAPPLAAVDEPEERKHGALARIRGMRLSTRQPPEDNVPQVRVRDLPPDVQMSFIRDRVIIVLVVGVLSFIFVRSWPLPVTLMIIAFVLDMVRRQRTAVLYVNGGVHPGARKATSKQLRRMRRGGYFTLDARPIPYSREVIDHLVVGPTGVYAIDSEKWNPRLPIRTWNNKKLYHGPESQKPRLEHAVWEASQASEILSSALGIEIKVRPALAIYGPKVPWDVATIRNVDVFSGPALGKYLRGRWRRRDDAEMRLTAEEVRTIYDTAVRVLPDVVTEHTPVG